MDQEKSGGVHCGWWGHCNEAPTQKMDHGSPKKIKD